MKKCNHCGKELVENALVCYGCGCAVEAALNEKKFSSTVEQLSETVIEGDGTNTDTVTNSSEIFCSHCGATLAEGQKFCSKCGCGTAASSNYGNTNDTNISNATNTSRKIGKKKCILFTVCSLLLVVIAVALKVFVFPKNNLTLDDFTKKPNKIVTLLTYGIPDTMSDDSWYYDNITFYGVDTDFITIHFDTGSSTTTDDYLVWPSSNIDVMEIHSLNRKICDTADRVDDEYIELLGYTNVDCYYKNIQLSYSTNGMNPYSGDLYFPMYFIEVD